MNKLKSLDIVEANLEWLSMNNEVITSLDEFALKTIKEDLENYQKLKLILKKKMGFNCQPVSHREEEQFTFYCKGLLSKKDKKLLERVINNDNTKTND